MEDHFELSAILPVVQLKLCIVWGWSTDLLPIIKNNNITEEVQVWKHARSILEWCISIIFFLQEMWHETFDTDSRAAFSLSPPQRLFLSVVLLAKPRSADVLRNAPLQLINKEVKKYIYSAGCHANFTLHALFHFFKKRICKIWRRPIGRYRWKERKLKRKRKEFSNLHTPEICYWLFSLHHF